MTTLVVAMYVVVSSTALVHGMSHAPRPDGHDTRGSHLAGSCSDDVDAAADCFVCHHGPAVSLAASPSAAAAPCLCLRAPVSTASGDAITCLVLPYAPLRAPPIRL